MEPINVDFSGRNQLNKKTTAHIHLAPNFVNLPVHGQERFVIEYVYSRLTVQLNKKLNQHVSLPVDSFNFLRVPRSFPYFNLCSSIHYKLNSVQFGSVQFYLI